LGPSGAAGGALSYDRVTQLEPRKSTDEGAQ
jgi:hypothetical protein